MVKWILSVNENNNAEIGTYPKVEADTTSDETFYTEVNLDYSSYGPLHIIEGHNLFTNISGLGYNKRTPVTIDIQDSYDGTVNLILIADGVKPKIINSGFSKINDTTAK